MDVEVREGRKKVCMHNLEMEALKKIKEKNFMHDRILIDI